MEADGRTTESAACQAPGAMTANRPSSWASWATASATAAGRSSVRRAQGRMPVERIDRGGSKEGSAARGTSAAISMISVGVR